jgi:hypothetical protein
MCFEVTGLVLLAILRSDILKPTRMDEPMDFALELRRNRSDAYPS